MENNIVITGIGLISRLGHNVEEFWHNRKSVQTTNFQYKGNTMPIEDFDPKQFLKRKLIKNLDTVTRYCVAATGMALEDSKIEIDKSKVGIVAGSVYNGIFSIFDVKDAYCQGGITNVSPLYFPGTVFNASAAQAAIEWKVTGPNCTVNSGTSSGLLAIVKGIQYLQLDKAKAMICGGNEMLFDYIVSNYSFLNQLSPTEEGFKPFDKNGKGMVLGEGACYFTLEAEKDAYDRGSKIYAKILNYFQNFNPNQEDQLSSMEECILSTVIKENCDYRNELDLIVVDGNGIPKNDKLIINAIEKVFIASSQCSTVILWK